MSPRSSTFALLAMAALLSASPSALYAFHEKGVANCDSCHTTHHSESGRPTTGSGRYGGDLLKDNPSDICLSCHATQQGAVLGGNLLAPPPEMGAGNFAFLLEDNLNDAFDGATDPIPGDAAGHNLLAPEYGLVSDPRYSFSPGGNFPTQQMGCTSCHDPHGNDSFRMLNGPGPVQDGSFAFSEPAPDAEGIALDSVSESRINHAAYRQGMSRWCGNCHGRYHEDGLTGFEHPSEERLHGEQQRQYWQYDGDDNPTGGLATSSYLPEVPFEDTFATIDSTTGPSASSRIMCLSCHRAHASSAPAAGRWDFKVAVLADDGVVSGSYPIPSPYRTPEQGTLCRKCHESGSGD